MDRSSKHVGIYYPLKTLSFAAALFCITLWAQPSPSTAALDLSKEPHHNLLFENSQVRVFRLQLQPGERTLPHRHERRYAYLGLQQLTIANEVRGRAPVVVDVNVGEVHTSNGKFTVTERNKSSEAGDLIVIEAGKTEVHECSTPISGFRYHDAAFAELFQVPGMRAYSMVIAAGGRTEKHEELYDRLLVAVSDLKIREDIAGQPSSEILMKAGDIKWIPAGMNHATSNAGEYPATFITFEFE